MCTCSSCLYSHHESSLLARYSRLRSLLPLAPFCVLPVFSMQLSRGNTLLFRLLCSLYLSDLPYWHYLCQALETLVLAQQQQQQQWTILFRVRRTHGILFYFLRNVRVELGLRTTASGGRKPLTAVGRVNTRRST